jgi:hypothetical protein
MSMQTFSTQEEFLKEFPIIDGVINCRLKSFTLLFDLFIQASIANAWDINAWDINAWDINARNINARDINAWDINARNINAWDINAWDINARNINARDISFYAVCIADDSIKCTSIEGRYANAKYFVFNGNITINGVVQGNNDAKEETKVSESGIKITDHITLKKIEKCLGYGVVSVSVVKEKLI